MTQPPATVTYSLEDVLGQIIQKLDRLDDRFNEKFDSLQGEVRVSPTSRVLTSCNQQLVQERWLDVQLHQHHYGDAGC